MEDDASQPTPPEEIDLGGDIRILVGPQGSQKSIKASSHLLAHASPYFKTLLGPHFQEGSAAAAGKDIVLKDDDPDAFHLLCDILHMRGVVSPEPLRPRVILNLAIVSDKYNCTSAMAMAARSLFPESIAGMAFLELATLTAAAYLLDQFQLFKSYTRSMALSYTESCTSVAIHLGAVPVPLIAWRKSQWSRSPSSGS